MRDIFEETPIIDAEEHQHACAQKRVGAVIDADREHSQILMRAIVDAVAEMKEQAPIIECM